MGRIKLKTASLAIFMILCFLTAMLALIVRVICVFPVKAGTLEIIAAGSVFPNASLPYELAFSSVKTEKIVKPEETKEKNDELLNDFDEIEEPEPGRIAYKVIESQFSSGGTQYENFYVNNKTGKDLNISEELKKCPDIKIKKGEAASVLIMHTHTCEAYLEKHRGFCYKDYAPRSTDGTRNVTRVGKALAGKLKDANIGVIHDVTCHDNPSYNGSYSRAAETIKKNLAENPSIQVVLDLHRDALGSNETGKLKPTFKVNGKKAAQIMVLAGYDEDGSEEFPDWEFNLRFALRIQQAAETMYPGMTRPMYFNSMRYNMNLTHGSVLIEVGTDVNTAAEAEYTGSLLGDVLVKVLSNLQDT